MKWKGMFMRFVSTMIFAGLLAGQQLPRLSDPMPAKDGETCVVCNTRVSEDDVAYLVDGQRVAVMKAMEKEFLDDPVAYVAKFRPEGMLYTVRRAGEDWSWHLWLGVIALLGVILIGAWMHGRVSAEGMLGKVALTSSSVPCPKCGTRNHASGKVCAGCRAEVA